MEISPKNSALINKIQTSAFQQYKDTHIDRQAIILGTGDTLLKFDNNLSCFNDCLRIGVKHMVCHPDIKMDYYFCGDVNERILPYFPKITALRPTYDKFAVTHILNEDGILTEGEPVLKAGQHGKGRLFQVNRYMSLKLAKSMGLTPFIIWETQEFHKDIISYPFRKGSIIFPAIQFALYIGCDRIYLVGCDGSGSFSFVEPEKTRSRKFGVKMYNLWASFKTFVKKEYPNVQILSVNPVKLQGLFKDKYL